MAKKNLKCRCFCHNMTVPIDTFTLYFFFKKTI